MVVQCRNYKCIYNDGDYCAAVKIVIGRGYEENDEQWVCQTQRTTADRLEKCKVCGKYHIEREE